MTQKYKEYAGTYELYYVNGNASVNSFEYYNIILEANGDCVVEYKLKGTSMHVSTSGTFEVGEGVIYFYTEAGGTKVTEKYNFMIGTDYEIHMKDIKIGQFKITAKFKRVSK